MMSSQQARGAGRGMEADYVHFLTGEASKAVLNVDPGQGRFDLRNCCVQCAADVVF